MSIPDWKRELTADEVIAVTPPNRRHRDQFLHRARGSLKEARLLHDAGHYTGAVIAAENAGRLAINALATADGARIIGKNRHHAAIEYARRRPGGFDATSAQALDVLRRTRNDGMYGDTRSEGVPVDVTDAQSTSAITTAQSAIRRVEKLVGPKIPPPPR